MHRHFTATAYVIQNDQVLLLMHPKIKRWLPPGGHVEANESPPECARREVLEETGLEVELIRDEHLWISCSYATSCERPFLCLIEDIPAYQNTEAHQHIDFIFLSRPIGGALFLKPEELRWFSLEEVMQLTDILPDTQQIIQTIFTHQFV
jgi:8-oxo-dGTP pyrophosphatase MutT (NUDIX family)